MIYAYRKYFLVLFLFCAGCASSERVDPFLEYETKIAGYSCSELSVEEKFYKKITSQYEDSVENSPSFIDDLKGDFGIKSDTLHEHYGTDKYVEKGRSETMIKKLEIIGNTQNAKGCK